MVLWFYGEFSHIWDHFRGCLILGRWDYLDKILPLVLYSCLAANGCLSIGSGLILGLQSDPAITENVWYLSWVVVYIKNIYIVMSISLRRYPRWNGWRNHLKSPFLMVIPPIFTIWDNLQPSMPSGKRHGTLHVTQENIQVLTIKISARHYAFGLPVWIRIHLCMYPQHAGCPSQCPRFSCGGFGVHTCEPVNLKRCQFLDFFSRPFDDGHNWNMLDPFGI